MKLKGTIQRLGGYFPGSFINMRLEFIADRKHNIYCNLSEVETTKDIQVKLLTSLSRACCKGVPEKVQVKIRTGLNNFLDTSFTMQDFALIYTELGNGVNNKLAYDFVNNNFNLNILKEQTTQQILDVVYQI